LLGVLGLALVVVEDARPEGLPKRKYRRATDSRRCVFRMSRMRRLASHLKPSGIVAFGEYNITPDAMRAPSDMPLTGKLFSWIDGAFRHAGAETRMGDRLFRTYRNVGLPNPTMCLMSYIGGGHQWDGYAYAAATVRSLLPLIIKAGLGTPEEMGIDTLEARLRELRFFIAQHADDTITRFSGAGFDQWTSTRNFWKSTARAIGWTRMRAGALPSPPGQAAANWLEIDSRMKRDF
jgi:hypothetical protein